MWNADGLVELNRRDERAAEAAFLKALDFAPRFGAAIRNLAALYERQRRYDKARRLLERWKP